MKPSTFFLFITLLLLPIIVSSECTCDKDAGDEINKSQALKYKLVAIATILVAGGIGVSLPSLGRFFPAFSPENDMFYIIKSFAAGVILATGMVHVLPDAFESLTNPCLPENPWGNFPFAGFVAMVSAMGTLMVDSFATGYFNRLHFKKKNSNNNKGGIEDGNNENDDEHEGHIHVHTHATHGHAHGSGVSIDDESAAAANLLRHRVISQAMSGRVIVKYIRLATVDLPSAGVYLEHSTCGRKTKRVKPKLSIENNQELDRAVSTMCLYFLSTIPFCCDPKII